MTRFYREGQPISATEYLATRNGARVPDRWISQAEREKAEAKADAKAKTKTKNNDADPGDEQKED